MPVLFPTGQRLLGRFCSRSRHLFSLLNSSFGNQLTIHCRITLNVILYTDGSISTTVYRIATHTDCYLDFMSHHPLAHKLTVVKTLHGKAEAMCSDMITKDQETRHIRQALVNNGNHTTPAPTRPTDD